MKKLFLLSLLLFSATKPNYENLESFKVAVFGQNLEKPETNSFIQEICFLYGGSCTKNNGSANKYNAHSLYKRRIGLIKNYDKKNSATLIIGGEKHYLNAQALDVLSFILKFDIEKINLVNASEESRFHALLKNIIEFKGQFQPIIKNILSQDITKIKERGSIFLHYLTTIINKINTLYFFYYTTNTNMIKNDETNANQPLAPILSTLYMSLFKMKNTFPNKSDNQIVFFAKFIQFF